MRFCQIVDGRVWWIFNANNKPEFASDVKIIDITNRDDVQEGYEYNESTGYFNPALKPSPIKQTIEDQIDQLKADNLVLMDAIATLYEAMLAKGMV